MQSKIRTVMMVSLLAALGGCAGTMVEDGPARLTYTWDADDRATRLAFNETHEACTREETVPAYEACMIRNGFARADY
ncbi:MAG: hypothetical protein V2J24_09215 [Pseudomonadales bacterium]|jgi:hypothetical protein|nr:hypothetical protein [Pseudomonadales bacterium]